MAASPSTSSSADEPVTRSSEPVLWTRRNQASTWRRVTPLVTLMDGVRLDAAIEPGDDSTQKFRVQLLYEDAQRLLRIGEAPAAATA